MPQVFGMSKVDVQQLFDALRAEGQLEIIGTEASVIESKWRRCSQSPFARACTAGLAYGSAVHSKLVTVRVAPAR